MSEQPGGAWTRDSLQAAAHVVRLPMRVRFRGLTEREVLLLHGPSGWGEFGPFVEYDDAESVRWLGAALEAAFGTQPAPVRDVVPVNATVPAVPASDVARILATYPGCVTAKVKVAESGQRLSDDVERVAAVADALGGASGRLRVDANGGWTVDEALSALPRLVAAAGPVEFEYAEQPCATLAELAAVRVGLVRRGIELRIAADESVRKADDPRRVAVAGAADVVMLKVAPLGGVGAALEVARELGDAHGLPVNVSSAIDSSVGLGAGLALAAALPELPFACGLATGSMLAEDVTDDPLIVARGRLPVRRVGVAPERLSRLAVEPERERWWRDRLDRVATLLEVGR